MDKQQQRELDMLASAVPRRVYDEYIKERYPELTYSPKSSTLREFSSQERTVEWAVEGALAVGQLAVLGGPVKSHKTSLAVDLAVSLGTGTPFLGCFTVPKPRCAALVSGESGPKALQDTFLRVCAARGVGASSADVHVSLCLPNIADSNHLLALNRWLRELRIEVVVLDPLYLCFPDGSAQPGNVYWMGWKLHAFCRACLGAGATPVLVAHTVKAQRGSVRLQDLAWSGVQEYARQWLLVSPRKRFDAAAGRQQLRMSVGGSLGHASEWNVDVTEGVLPHRRWEVRAEQLGAPAAAAAPAELTGPELLVKGHLLACGGECSVNAAARALSAELTKGGVRKALRSLARRGVVELRPVAVRVGGGATRSADGAALV